MTGPRTLRLVRTPTLRALQRALAVLVGGMPAARARSAAVVVPSASAAAQLRRTVERLLFGAAPPTSAEAARLDVSPSRAPVVCWPDVVTRAGLHARLHARLPGAPPLLDEFERETLMRAAAHEAVRDGAVPPFAVRPGLIAALLRFYDNVARLRRTVDDVERVLLSSLEDEAEVDSGAARLLEQTRFVVAAFRGFERRRAGLEAVDEHGVRALALAQSPRPAYRHVIVTVGDVSSDRSGLWPADFELLSRLPGLERLDVVLTDRQLGAGLYERLEERLPGIEPCAFDAFEPLPVLEVPDTVESPPYRLARDREEELAAVVRSLKWALVHDGAHAAPPDEHAVVVQRPLPYLYLARHTLDAAGVPWTAADALPLAAEPYAAAVDLVCDAVIGDFTRGAVVALLRSPQFRFADPTGRPLGIDDVAAIDAVLEATGFFGGHERLADLLGSRADEGAAAGASSAARALGRAAAVARDVVAALVAFAEPRLLSSHAEALLDFLEAHEAEPSGVDDEVASRHRRARAAVRGALGRLRDAARALDDPVTPFRDLVATLRRWVESRTFEPRVGVSGVHVLDAQAARFADVSVAAVLGLVEGDWPERTQPDVLYPASLLADLGWPRETDRIVAARAAFADLLRLPRTRVSVSTFTLEDDVIVQPAVLLDELEGCGLPLARRAAPPPARVFADEGLVLAPVVAPGLPEAEARLARRRERPPASDPRFHGHVGAFQRARHAVTHVDRYLECPFRYFAERALDLGDEREDEPGLTPRERGELAHGIFQTFFERWRAAGHGAITDETLERARALLVEVVDEALAGADPADAAIERARLLGSAVSPAMGERVLRYEVERDERVVDRRLEEPLDGTYRFHDETGGEHQLSIRGKADRIDLLADGSLVLVDYKTGRAPDARSVQLPIYAHVAEQRLAGVGRAAWRARAADYLAFRGKAVTHALGRTEAERDERLARAQQSFVDAVAAIGRGEFPPRPVEPRLCTWCPYDRVCRKDYEGPGDA